MKIFVPKVVILYPPKTKVEKKNRVQIQYFKRPLEQIRSTVFFFWLTAF